MQDVTSRLSGVLIDTSLWVIIAPSVIERLTRTQGDTMESRILELDAVQCDVCWLTHPIGECTVNKTPRILDIKDIYDTFSTSKAIEGEDRGELSEESGDNPTNYI